MDTIHYLLSKIKIIIISICLILFLIWLGRLISPLLPQEWFHRSKEVSTKNASSSTEFFLPTPRLSDSTGQKPVTATDNIFVLEGNETSGLAFNAYDETNTYSQGSWQPNAEGQYIYVQPNTNQKVDTSGGQVFDSTKAGFSQMSAYIRSITIPLGAYVYRGLVFHGQARESMFVDGKFSLYVIDVKGNVIGKGEAVTDEDWRSIGWHKFTARITTPIPPNSVGCGLVFQQDKVRGLHATMPVRCP